MHVTCTSRSGPPSPSPSHHTPTPLSYAAIFKHTKDELGFCYYLIPCGANKADDQLGSVKVWVGGCGGGGDAPTRARACACVQPHIEPCSPAPAAPRVALPAMRMCVAPPPTPQRPHPTPPHPPSLLCSAAI